MRPLKGEKLSEYLARVETNEEFRAQFPVLAVRMRVAQNFYVHRHHDEFWARRAAFKKGA